MGVVGHGQQRNMIDQGETEQKTSHCKVEGEAQEGWALRSCSMGVAAKFEQGGYRLEVRRVREPVFDPLISDRTKSIPIFHSRHDQKEEEDLQF